MVMLVADQHARKLDQDRRKSHLPSLIRYPATGRGRCSPRAIDRDAGDHRRLEGKGMSFCLRINMTSSVLRAETEL